MEPQGKTTPGNALIITYSYHLILIHFLCETNFEKLCLASSNFSLGNPKYSLKKEKYVGVYQEFQRNDSALRMEVEESFVKLSDNDTLKTSQFYYELLLLLSSDNLDHYQDSIIILFNNNFVI